MTSGPWARGRARMAVVAALVALLLAPGPIPAAGRTVPPGAVAGTVLSCSWHGAEGSLFVEVAGARRSFRVNRGAGLRLAAGGTAFWEMLLPGDWVEVTPAAGGGPARVTAFPQVVSGQVVFAKAPKLVMDSGAVVLVSPSAAVTVNGRSAALEDITVGDMAYVRLNDQGKQATIVDLWRRAVVSTLATPDPAKPSPLLPGMTAVTHTATRPLRAGEQIMFTVRGPKGGRVRLDILGVAHDLQAQEASPGRYQVRFVAPAGLDVPYGIAVAHLTVGGREAVPRLSPPLALAPTPPIIQSFGPQATVNADRPDLEVTFSSPGAVVNAAACRLWLDGRPITGDVVVRTVYLLWYRPDQPLPPGRHQVKVLVEDTAGNQSQVSWSFVLTSPAP